MNMKYHVLPFIVLILLSAHIQAQALLDFDFAKYMAGSSNEEPYSMVIDDQKNIILVGSYTGITDFDPRPFQDSPLISNGGDDIFIAKYDSTGQILWVQGIGASGLDRARDVAVDLNGNIVVVGEFNGTVNFDSAAVQPAISAVNWTDAFLAKYDPNGGLIFAMPLGGSDHDYGRAVQCDLQGNIYLTGDTYSSSIDLNPNGTPIVRQRSGQSGSGVFLAKYTPLGNHIWSGIFTDFNSAKVASVEVFALDLDDSSNVYVTGHFNGDDIDFNFRNGSALRGTSGGRYGFLVKYDSSGVYDWVLDFGFSNSHAIPYDLALTANQDILICGEFRGTVPFDPFSPNGTLVNTSATKEDGFFASYDGDNGNFIYAKSIVGGDNDEVRSICQGPNSTVYILGESESANLDLDPGPLNTSLANGGSNDVFIAVYDSLGTFFRGFNMNGSGDDVSRKIRPQGDARILITGRTGSDSLDFDPSQSTTPYQSEGAGDIFLVRYTSQCQVLVDSIALDTCSGFVGPSGRVYNTTGVYIDTVPNVSASCDSLYYIDLVVRSINKAVIRSGDTLKVLDSNSTYQWGLCGSSFVPITNETSQSFIVPRNDIYACVISRDGCTDTSECISISDLRINEYSSNLFTIYPNPAKDVLLISSTLEGFLPVELRITNSSGQRVLTQLWFNLNEKSIDISSIASGFYQYEILVDSRIIQNGKLTIK